MSKISQIGLIVEDNSDYEVFRLLILKIIEKEKFKFSKFAGGGCGKMKRKAVSYAKLLFQKGCEIVILVHDLDRNDLIKLQAELQALTEKSPAPHNFVCIPIEEVEAWLHSDSPNIKEVFKLKKSVQEFHHPETIKSPKENLEKLIIKLSRKRKRYINTVHNTSLAESIDIGKISQRCPSFQKLETYLKQDIFDYK